MMKRIFVFAYMIVAGLLCSTGIFAAASERVYTPSEMINPNIANRYHYICDPAGLLSRQTTDEVNQRLYNLRIQTTCEVLVAIAPSIGDQNEEQWCADLFASWGIGKSDKDNGALLVIVPGNRFARIQTGYGVEGVLTDIACSKIIRNDVIPYMKEDNLDAAVNEATLHISRALSDPEVAEELKSEETDNFSGMGEALDKDVFLNFLCWCAGVIFLLSLITFIVDVVKGRKMDTYHRALLWKSDLNGFFWLGVCSAGAGLIFYLMAWLYYRRARTKRRVCPTCGAKMNRLGEKEDNELLNDSQDFEERLNTVDYDVWECPTCGTIERFPYKVKQEKYSECPACHTVAMTLDHEIILRQPTTRTEGEGEKVYVCKFCGHNDHRRFKIDKKPDPSAALVAGAVLGSMTRGGGGGGGSFGGGLGGGMSGGGGASGRW